MRWEQRRTTTLTNWHTYEPRGDGNKYRKRQHQFPHARPYATNCLTAPPTDHHDAKGNKRSRLRCYSRSVPRSHEMIFKKQADLTKHRDTDRVLTSLPMGRPGTPIGTRTDGTPTLVNRAVRQQDSPTTPRAPSVQPNDNYAYASYIDNPSLSRNRRKQYYHRCQTVRVIALNQSASRKMSGTLSQYGTPTTYSTPAITHARDARENNRYTYTSVEFDEAWTLQLPRPTHVLRLCRLGFSQKTHCVFDVSSFYRHISFVLPAVHPGSTSRPGGE